MRLLLTRPQEDSEKLAQQLRKHGIDSIISPVLEIKYLDQSLKQVTSTDAIFISSRHAIAQADETIKHVPLYTVGESTANFARQQGFSDVRMAGGTLAEAAAGLKNNTDIQSLLYLRGRDISESLIALLPHITVNERITYQASAVNSMKPEAFTALKEKNVQGVIFYSARTARIFAQMATESEIKSLLVPLFAFCLSEQIRGSLTKDLWRDVIVAEQPDSDSLIKCIKEVKSAHSLL